MVVSWRRGDRSKFVAAPMFNGPTSEAQKRAVGDLPILEALDLHTFYGLSHILHGISLAVRPGETIGLMGRNGMGKTTLIRTLVRHVRPRRGRVMVNVPDQRANQGCLPHSVSPHQADRLDPKSQ